jgi:tetratricopeptide (TPR) repeat protein
VRPRLVLVTASVAALGGAASAEVYYDRGYTPPPQNTEFWREVVEPHADEVALVLGKISQAMDYANQVTYSDTDVDGSQRRRLLDDARGMAKYLRRLAPQNTEVLLALGKAADEAGRADEALEALKAYLDIEPEGSEAAFRVGRIYLRMREYDDAIRYLRIADAGGASWLTSASVYLASALAATGRGDEAIAELEDTVGYGQLGGWGGDPQIPAFALAVAYDRDEQITEAFEVLDRMQQNMQGGFISEMQRQLDQLQLAPPGEVHYYRGLLYESGGYLDEARASWMLYASDGELAQYRERALQHVAAIDVLMRDTVAARKPGTKQHAAAAAAASALGTGVWGGMYPPPPPPPVKKRPPKKHRKKKKANP